MSTKINQPRTNFNLASANQTIENTSQRVLIVGQSLNRGSLQGELIENIGNNGEEDVLFGSGAPLAQMVRAYKKRNKQVRVDTIALLEDASMARLSLELMLNFGENVISEPNTLRLVLGSSQEEYVIQLEVGDDIDAIDAKVFQATRTIDTDVFDIECSTIDSSTLGVFLGSQSRGSYASVNYVISASLDSENELFSASVDTETNFTLGAGEPDLTAVFDSVAQERYQSIVWPYPNNLEPLTDFLDPRFNADGIVVDGLGITAINSTVSNLIDLGEAQNSASLVVIAGKANAPVNGSEYYLGGDIPENPMYKAAQFAAIRSLRLDPLGFNIADLVVGSNGALDGFGGAALASKPLFNTPFANLPLSRTGEGFDAQEIQQLQDVGISVLGNNIAGNGVIAGEIVTTYKTDAAGNPDETFKFLNYVDTSSQIREFYFNNFRARFAQSRLTEGDLVLGRDMANANAVRSFAKRLFITLSGVDYVLVESGEEALTFFEENLFVTIDKAAGIVTIIMTVPIVTQYRETQATIRIAFSINS